MICETCEYDPSVCGWIPYINIDGYTDGCHGYEERTINACYAPMAVGF